MTIKLTNIHCSEKSLTNQIFHLPWVLPASEQIPKFRVLQKHYIFTSSCMLDLLSLLHLLLLSLHYSTPSSVLPSCFNFSPNFHSPVSSPVPLYLPFPYPSTFLSSRPYSVFSPYSLPATHMRQNQIYILEQQYSWRNKAVQLLIIMQELWNCSKFHTEIGLM